MQDSPKIIICTERGKLEKYAILLCRSIRTFGGELADADIFSFAPRKGTEPRQSTIKEFKRLNVKHENIELNKKYRHYPLANKPLVCAHMEQLFPKSRLVFIDSDQVVFNSPTLFIEDAKSTVFLRPVDRKGIGFSSKDEVNYSYWNKLENLLSFSFEGIQPIETSVGESIYPYFNSGLIITDAQNNLFTKWRENFELAFSQKLFPKSDLFFLEQSLFTATVLQQKINVKPLPINYNYPFGFVYDELPEKNKLKDLSEMVTAHYHDVLLSRPFPRFLMHFLQNTNKGQWLASQIDELKIKPESKLKRLREKLKNKLTK